MTSPRMYATASPWERAFGRQPFACGNPQLIWERKKTILANLPPATIWVLGPGNLP